MSMYNIVCDSVTCFPSERCVYEGQLSNSSMCAKNIHKCDMHLIILAISHI